MTNHLTEPLIGKLLEDRYLILQNLAEQSYGKVYLAKDELLGVNVSLKLLNPLLLSEKFLNQFIQEARLGASFRDDDCLLPRVLDFGLYEDRMPFYVFDIREYLLLAEFFNNNSVVIHQFIELASQLSKALSLVHVGPAGQMKDFGPMLHRDINPRTILMSEGSVEARIQLLNFEKALAREQCLTGDVSHVFLGSLAYCSPEQIFALPMDVRSDIYSFGVTLYYLLTNTYPVQSVSDSVSSWSLAHKTSLAIALKTQECIFPIPDWLRRLVMSCIEHSPENRPQTMEEVTAALRQF